MRVLGVAEASLAFVHSTSMALFRALAFERCARKTPQVGVLLAMIIGGMRVSPFAATPEWSKGEFAPEAAGKHSLSEGWRGENVPTFMAYFFFDSQFIQQINLRSDLNCTLRRS